MRRLLKAKLPRPMGVRQSEYHLPPISHPTDRPPSRWRERLGIALWYVGLAALPLAWWWFLVHITR